MAESASSPVALLDRHLEAFNHGVRTGDFARMLAMYETDAVFELAAPVSVTHEGLGAIRDAYRDNPLNDTMRLGEPSWPNSRIGTPKLTDRRSETHGWANRGRGSACDA
jgi:hypothetical protein